MPHLMAKGVLIVAVKDAKAACRVNHLCSSLKTGTEGVLDALCFLNFFLSVDSNEAFHEDNVNEMYWISNINAL